MQTKKWISPFHYYYKVSDEDGKVRYQSVFQQDCLNYISNVFERTKVLLNMEQIHRPQDN